MTGTEKLIADLASKGAAASPYAMRRFVMPLVIVSLLSALALLAMLEPPFGSVGLHGIWPMAVKWGFSLPLVIASALALHSLSKPGRKSASHSALLALPFIALLVLLMAELATGDASMPASGWERCLAAMGIFGPLAFAGAIIAARWMAPTNLRSAGFVAGLFGGGVAMSAYAPFCLGEGMIYMALFYGLPIAAMAGAGWLLGPRLLRW